MTREESAMMTKKRIREAKCGSDIAQAIIEHFKQFKNDQVEESPVEVFTAPLLDNFSKLSSNISDDIYTPYDFGKL